EFRVTIRAGNIDIFPVIGNVKDQQRMRESVGTCRPFIIYHSAARKHVPCLLYNPLGAVRRYSIVSNDLADSAHSCGVNTFALISSDKAVNPTKVMGASIRSAEMVIQDLNSRS